MSYRHKTNIPMTIDPDVVEDAGSAPDQETASQGELKTEDHYPSGTEIKVDEDLRHPPRQEKKRK